MFVEELEVLRDLLELHGLFAAVDDAFGALGDVRSYLFGTFAVLLSPQRKERA